MKNIFIITLGTREIQFRKEMLMQHGFEITPEKLLQHTKLEIPAFKVYQNDNYPDFYCCSFPRIAGGIILTHYDVFKPVLEFPLIDHAYSDIIKEHRIDNLMLVYTDQRDLDLADSLQRRNFERDTLFFRDILRLHVGNRLNNSVDDFPVDIPVTHKTTDIDFQYRDFAIKCRILFDMEKDIHQVFLLAQGGIDQINHALTLQLIQAFGDKVKLWQQAEGEGPRNLQFPFMFIKDLNKQKVLKHLEDYDFGLIAKMEGLENTIVSDLADYAYKRLNLDYSVIPEAAKGFHSDVSKEEITLDLYLSAKINYHKGDFGNYLWKLFTLFENIYRVKCDRLLGDTQIYFRVGSGENAGWVKKLQSIEGLYEFLSKKRTSKGSLKFDNPNRLTYKHIYNYLCNKKLLEDDPESTRKLNEVFNLAESLLAHRNRLAHYLTPINKSIIEGALEKKSCDYLNQTIDSLFQLNSDMPFGVYSKIRSKIQTML